MNNLFDILFFTLSPLSIFHLLNTSGLVTFQVYSSCLDLWAANEQLAQDYNLNLLGVGIEI